MGLLGRRSALGKTGPREVELGFEYNFENSFEVLFEFNLHSNSNHTHLTPNKIQKNPTRIFYKNLNIYFYK
jgi:hypothetical protein